MSKKENGAVAVEFALVLPILITLVLGIMEFGWAFFLNGSAAGAAREGARWMAIDDDRSSAESAAREAFIVDDPSLVSIGIRVEDATGASVTDCASGTRVSVTVEYSYGSLVGYFGDGFVAKGTGVMRCGG